MLEDLLLIPVPRLDRLMELRDALVALKGPLADDPALQENLQKHLFNEEADIRVLGHLNPVPSQKEHLMSLGEAT
ncbi:hypothetical protein PSAN_42550 [Pseudomonas antarctica]|uniref:Type VI secretion system protein ImpB n=1 Tax=Pseudomonas antarctica TaxID=219572 RepID=A0ABQ6ZSD9_9PSED|nr:hypothetical protein PSAN_42550 [Pseudomonas antarctica]